MTFTELKEAQTVLGLNDRATLKEIKTRHRELVKKFHPDTGNKQEPETIRAVNSAYKVITDYLAEYRFSFTEEEFYEQFEEENIRRQFEEFYA